ncbi:unnamed protein product [Brassicogethes aeneus]|uniref:CN hydrolase domain-containing protein n=1 Tax=Brassicogethes aeneus TaxID=1431903 RepID=A0A9P0FF64_BRAAE|nr:unnamed protein product [Brassicogethes aeneus]
MYLRVQLILIFCCYWQSILANIDIVSELNLRRDIWGTKEEPSPKQVAKTNADWFASDIAAFKGNVIVYPEYALTTNAVVQLISIIDLKDYATQVPDERANLCPNVSSPTMVFRKEENFLETSAISANPNPENRTILLDNKEMSLIMGYEILKAKSQYDVIYFASEITPILPFLLDTSLMAGFSKVYQVNVKSPNLRSSNIDETLPLTHREDIVEIDNKKGLTNEPKLKTDIANEGLYKIDDNKYNLIKIVNKTASYEKCTVVIESDDEKLIQKNYRLAVFKGNFTIHSKIQFLQVCGLVRTSNDKQIQLNLSEAKSTFKNVTITLESTGSKPLPITLKSDLKPLGHNQYTYYKEEGKYIVKSNEPISDIVSYGIILGDEFSDDGSDKIRYGKGYQYIVGVIEYNPFTNTSAVENIIEYNIAAYKTEIELLKQRNAEIVVFPEYGLTGKTLNTSYAQHVPKLSLEKIDYKDNIERLSNMAKEHSIALAVNLMEFETINDKTYFFNTEVIFDKNGQIIAKHRKINLNDEEKKVLTPGSNATVVEINGNRFRVLINEDLFSPLANFLNGTNNLAGYIVSMSWKNQFPFEIATSIQAGFAISNEIPVIAANLNAPSVGISGSGVYHYENSLTKSCSITGKSGISRNILDCHVKNIDMDPKMGKNAIETMELNIEAYRGILEDLRYTNTTIAVFPEYGLTGITNNVEEYALEISNNSSNFNQCSGQHLMPHEMQLLHPFVEPDLLQQVARLHLPLQPRSLQQAPRFSEFFRHSVCRQVSPMGNGGRFPLAEADWSIDVLNYLSDMAIEHNITLVINLLEKSDDKYYNTNVVYNHKGNIISKYRKINLNDEPNLTPGNNLSWFNINSQLYALMTVNDVLFKNPSEIILKQNKKNSTFNKPLNINNKFKNMFYEKNVGYASDILPLNTKVSLKVNHLTCSVKVNYTENTKSNFYLKVILFDGKDIEVGGKRQSQMFCSFFHCESDEIDSCGNIINENIQFHKISVTLKSDININNGSSIDLIRPITLRSNLNPVENYNYSVDRNTVSLSGENLPKGTLVFGVLALKDHSDFSSGISKGCKVGPAIIRECKGPPKSMEHISLRLHVINC